LFAVGQCRGVNDRNLGVRDDDQTHETWLRLVADEIIGVSGHQEKFELAREIASRCRSSADDKEMDKAA
jgi:hypothetical protein